MIELDNADYLKHVDIYVSEDSGFPKTTSVYVTDAGPNSSGVYKINWVSSSAPSTRIVDVWTAYPD